MQRLRLGGWSFLGWKRKKKRETKPLSDLILNEDRRNEKIVLIISEYTACVMFVACDL